MVDAEEVIQVSEAKTFELRQSYIDEVPITEHAWGPYKPDICKPDFWLKDPKLNFV